MNEDDDFLCKLSLSTFVSLLNESLDDDADDPDYENSSESESVIGEVEDDDQSDIGEGDGAEVEIEGDFECVSYKMLITFTHPDHFFSRLVANVRSLDGPSGSGLLSRDWDFNLEDQYAEFRDDLRAASGIGRGKRGVRCQIFVPVTFF